jgi:hypothetical protein
VVIFVFFLLVLELLRQCGIFCIFSIGFGTVATAWYFFYFFYWFWNCCDSVVFFLLFLLVLELLRQLGIFCIFFIGFGTVATAWLKYKKYHAVATVPKPIEIK